MSQLRQKLKLNSADRVNIAGPSDFAIELDTPMSGTYQLYSLYMPMVFNNVSESNNKLYFIENEVPKTASLASGIYKGSATLITQVLLALNTISDGVNTYSAR